MFFHLEVFQAVCHMLGMPIVDLLNSRFKSKLDRFAIKTRNPQAFTVDAPPTPLNSFPSFEALSSSSLQDQEKREFQ